MSRRALPLRPIVAVAGGALAGLSLPPLGWWPMGIIGIGAVAWAIRNRGFRARLGLGMLAGIGQFTVSLAWAIQFNIAGYVALSIVEALFVAVACALIPRGGGQLPALAGALTLAEYGRESWPFGGLPLGGIVLGQVAGPLAATARIGGGLLVMGVTVLAGAGLAALVPDWDRKAASEPVRAFGSHTPETAYHLPPEPPGDADGAALETTDPPPPTDRRRSPLPALVALVAVVVITVVGALAPAGGGGTPARLRVALVQGGGRRGLNQLEVPPIKVFDAAVAETTKVPQGTQLILWPEDVVALQAPLQGSATSIQLGQIARAHDATLIAGVTYPVGATQFRNEIVAYSPTGHLVATFEKVHRVPFGEYVPWRSFFAHFANLKDVPRDAIPGNGSGLISTPAGRFGVLVSYEVFFADRGRSGVRAGGAAILVPTNTSSYSNGQAPAQEIAASRLQAIEEGRYVLQAAPTGYTAVINNHGDVLAQTHLSVAAVVTARVPLLSGRTWYEQAGDLPIVIAALALLAGGWILALVGAGGAADNANDAGDGSDATVDAGGAAADDAGGPAAADETGSAGLSPAKPRRRRRTSPSH